MAVDFISDHVCGKKLAQVRQVFSCLNLFFCSHRVHKSSLIVPNGLFTLAEILVEAEFLGSSLV